MGDHCSISKGGNRGGAALPLTAPSGVPGFSFCPPIHSTSYIDRVRDLPLQISRVVDIESPSKSLRLAFVNSSKRFAAQNTRSERLVGSDLAGPVKCEPNSAESAT